MFVSVNTLLLQIIVRCIHGDYDRIMIVITQNYCL